MDEFKIGVLVKRKVDYTGSTGNQNILKGDIGLIVKKSKDVIEVRYFKGPILRTFANFSEIFEIIKEKDNNDV
jgi:hypothetical protein